MARKSKQSPKAVPATPAVVVESNAPVAAPKVGRIRLPFVEAKGHNKGFVLLAGDAQVVSANVALTSKGTNAKRQRVYGYDNFANNGGVPKQAKVAVIAGAQCPKGVNPGQWDLLVSLAGNTVEHCYGNKVASRTVRRAYRAGVIRFVQA